MANELRPLLKYQTANSREGGLNSWVSSYLVAMSGLTGGAAFTTWWIGTYGMFANPGQIIYGLGALSCVLAVFAGCRRLSALERERRRESK